MSNLISLWLIFCKINCSQVFGEKKKKKIETIPNPYKRRIEPHIGHISNYYDGKTLSRLLLPSCPPCDQLW